MKNRITEKDFRTQPDQWTGPAADIDLGLHGWIQKSLSQSELRQKETRYVCLIGVNYRWTRKACFAKRDGEKRREKGRNGQTRTVKIKSRLLPQLFTTYSSPLIINKSLLSGFSFSSVFVAVAVVVVVYASLSLPPFPWHLPLSPSHLNPPPTINSMGLIVPHSS